MEPKEESWRTFEQRGAACRLRGDAAGCARAYYEAAQCDRFLRSQREHYSSYLFTLHYLSGISAEELARQHFVYGQLYRDELAEMEAGGGEAEPAAMAGHRLRIGFLAPDLLESSAARFYEAMLDLPQAAFEVFVYSLTDIADGFTQHVWRTAEHARVLPPHDIEASERAIAADKLDILVDLGGHTAGGATLMLLAHHPARIIIEAVGWFDTTGMPTVDYLLTDDIMDPPGREALLSEQPLRLPHAWCFTPSKAMRAARERVASSYRDSQTPLPSQAPSRAPAPPAGEPWPVRLASFQNFLKISDDVLDAWRAILERAPQAHLLLQDTMRVPARVAELERRMHAAGLPMERVTARMGSDDYLDDLAQQDLILDTFPYPGGAMTATALYLGVPVLTLRGDSHSRSVGASILTAAGLPELVAESAGRYIGMAAELIVQPEKRMALRTRVLEGVLLSPLCDPAAYQKNFFDFFSKIT